MPLGSGSGAAPHGLQIAPCLAVVEEAPTALAIFDRDGHCVSASRGWQQQFGPDAAAFLGKTAGGALRGRTMALADAVKAAFRGKASSGVDRDPRPQADIDRWVFWKAWPIVPDGQLVAVCLFDRPTAGQDTGSGRGDSAVGIENVTAALGIGLLEHDFATGVTTLSDTYVRLLGIRRDTIPKTDAEWIDLLRVRDRAAYESARRRALDTAGDGVFEFDVWPVVDGEERCMRIQSRVLFVGEGADRQPCKVIGLLVDRTKDRNMEVALARAQRLETVGRLAGMVAHDFNNILSVILGNLELAIPKVEDPAACALLTNAMEATQMGAGFNRRLLTLAGGHGGQAVRFNLDAHLGQTWEIYRRVLREDIILQFEPGSEGAFVMADPAEIDAAILNLVVNARDAQLEGGRIVISTCRQGKAKAGTQPETAERRHPCVMISVADDGPGMSTDIARRAGEPFFTTKPNGMGSGLGLASVIATAERAGGTFRIETGSQGTTATIILPTCDDTGKPTATHEGDIPMGQGQSILVVEDDPLVREVAMQRLEALGYVVSEASNAEAALAVIRGGTPVDLVFSDIVLPGGPSGLDLAATLQKERPLISVLLTSGHASAVYRGSKEPAVTPDILAKPYNLRALACAVHDSIAPAG